MIDHTNNTITKFTVFGERNSGTTYLEKTLKKMLKLKYTKEYGFKHWYIKDLEPRGIKNTTTDNECIKNINDSDDTLFIVIVRNVYDWVKSMYKKPHHMKNIDKSSIYNFISKKYICFENKCQNNHKKNNNTPWCINKDNKYPYFIEESTNLIELRNLKNNHFYNLKNNVKHYFLVRQEHLLDDIKKMINQHKLKYNFLNLPNYRKPKKYILDKKTVTFINNNLNNNIDNNIYTLKYEFKNINNQPKNKKQLQKKRQQMLQKKRQQILQKRRQLQKKRQQILQKRRQLQKKR